MDPRILGIKKKLEAERDQILAQAEHALTTDLKPERENFPDLSDQASAESDRGFLIRLRGREQQLLKKVDEAIERIEDGTFGICEGCGEKIPIKRLEARPVTTLCIECKTRQEEDERLRE